MRIMIPKVKCSYCSKKMYINAVPLAYPSEGKIIYVCKQCEVDHKKKIPNTQQRGDKQ